MIGQPLGQPGIPARVRAVIADRLISVGHLELFLFLYETRHRTWTVDELGNEMRSNAGMVLRQVLDLREAVVFDSDVVCFSRDPKWHATAEEVATLYKTRRHSLIAAIYDRPLEAIRNFADAFKIKKDGEEE